MKLRQEGKEELQGKEELPSKPQSPPSAENKETENKERKKPVVVPAPVNLLPVSHVPDASPASSLPSLSPAKRKILATLSDLAALGLTAPTRPHVALFAGASPTSGAYGKNLTELSAGDLLTYPRPGCLALTPAGRKLAPASRRLLSRRMLHDAWLGRLPDAQKRIVRALIGCYPAALSRAALADRVGASPTSGAYGKNLTELKDLGLVTYPHVGHVAAAALLFPKGLPE